MQNEPIALFSATSTVIGSQVTLKHFQSAFENRHQQLTETAPFAIVRDRLDIQTLRYPGGTQTENGFDPGNPNATWHENIFEVKGQHTRFTPIADFMDYAARNSVGVVIVLPTWRYFDTESRSINTSAEAEIKEFVSDLVTGVHGSARIEAFEVGNEWFNPAFSWSGKEFGDLQARIVDWVDEALASVATNNRPAIWVQSSSHGQADRDGNGISDNVEIRDALGPEGLAKINGVVDHFYQPTRGETIFDTTYVDEDLVASGRVNRMVKDGWNLSEGGLDLVTTEWNVRDLGDDGPYITGLEKLPLVARLFSDMMVSGVDVAQIFTIEGLGKTSASLARKGSTDLTPTGVLFSLMKNSLVGTMVLDDNGDGKLSKDEFLISDNSGRPLGYRLEYQGDDKYVSMFGSGVGHAASLSVDISRLIKEGYFPSLVRITSSGGDPASTSADARIETISLAGTDNLSDFENLVIDFNPYDFYQLTLVKGQGINLVIEGVNQKASILEGSPWDDFLFGGKGNDKILGSSGNDKLAGGLGDDTVIGGSGDDTVHGGQGSDLLIGGDGRDTFVFMRSDVSEASVFKKRIMDYSVDDVIDLRDFHISTSHRGEVVHQPISVQGSGSEILLSLDCDADGLSDLEVSVFSTQGLNPRDVLESILL